MVDNAARTVAELSQKLYSKGWALAPGTGAAIRVGPRVFAPPAEVHLDRLEPEDVFTLSAELGPQGCPELDAEAINPAFNISPHTTIFLRLFDTYDCSCILYCQPRPALVTAAVHRTMFSIQDQQAISLITNGETKAQLSASDKLRVPIIPHPGTQDQLLAKLEQAFEANPQSNAVLIKGHGLVVVGDSWQQAWIMLEALVSLFSLSLELRAAGVTREVKKVEQQVPPVAKVSAALKAKPVVKELAVVKIPADNGIKPPTKTWSGPSDVKNLKPAAARSQSSFFTPADTVGRVGGSIGSLNLEMMARQNDLALRRKKLALARLRANASVGPHPQRMTAASFMDPPSLHPSLMSAATYPAMPPTYNPSGFVIGQSEGGRGQGPAAGPMSSRAEGWEARHAPYPPMAMRGKGAGRNSMFQSLSKQQRGSVKDRLGFQSSISVDPSFM